MNFLWPRKRVAMAGHVHLRHFLGESIISRLIAAVTHEGRFPHCRVAPRCRAARAVCKLMTNANLVGQAISHEPASILLIKAGLGGRHRQGSYLVRALG
jgi:hypothetical protein